MVGQYIIYANINGEGWNIILKTGSRKEFESMIWKIMQYDEPISIITKFKTKKCDYPLVAFHNKCPVMNFNLGKAYQLLPKDD